LGISRKNFFGQDKVVAAGFSRRKQAQPKGCGYLYVI